MRNITLRFTVLMTLSPCGKHEVKVIFVYVITSCKCKGKGKGQSVTWLRKHTAEAEVQLPDVRQTAYIYFISACQYTRGIVRAEITSVRLLQEQQIWLS